MGLDGQSTPNSLVGGSPQTSLETEATLTVDSPAVFMHETCVHNLAGEGLQ